MTMSHFQEYGIRPFCDQLNLQFREFFYGYNPGRWKSRLTNNRLVCILESDGNSTFQDGKETVPLLPGTVVLIPAFHEITHDQNGSMLHLSIHFGLEFYYGVDLLMRLPDLWHATGTGQIGMIRRMLAPPDRLRMTATMQMLCWNAAARALDAARIPVDTLLSGYSRYAPLFDHLLRNCHAGIDVARMAEIMRMNKETFIKKFIYDTGFAPKHFFNRLLVSRATRLLSGTDMTIRETALELKFCNEFYFSRFFKHHLGISPRDYRKHYRNTPENREALSRETERIAPQEMTEN